MESITFEKYFNEIYPEELELRRENLSSTKASFLDIYLEKEENRISTKLSDKSDFLPI